MIPNKIFEGIPSYLGGKRALVKHILPELTGNIVADVFAGGCSVSLACLWQNKQVISSDIAYRAGIVAESLIVNNSLLLSDEDIYSLFLPNKEKDDFVSKNFGKYFTPEVANFLDLALANIKLKQYPLNKLLELSLYKYIMSQRQFGQFGHSEDQKLITEGKTIELLEKSSESRAKKVEKMIAHPLPVLLEIKEQINNAIYRSPHQNEFHQMDCFDFLKKMKDEKRKIDVAYYDSPYDCCLAKYSEIYSVIDKIFEGNKKLKIDDGAFNGNDALKNFEKMFALSEGIPKWVISMGCSRDKGIKGEELLEVVQKFRPATLKYLDHNWTVNNITKTKNCKNGRRQEDNTEYLISTK